MSSGKFQLKVPKGTKDWADKDMVLRTAIFDTIVSVFKRHGGVTLDTPVFELKEILAGKYGEDSKLIYDLKDQGGELCSLRYDLTVPFARYLAMNPTVQSMKRFHIAKVYRRDQPAMTKGRMREFYQCDFDIAGTFESMIPDAEILAIGVETLSDLGIKDFKAKLNHRGILDGIFQTCGVPEADVRKISSAVDKLDKLPWADVKKEMTIEKGLPEEVADKIGEYVKLKGGPELLEQLKADQSLMSNTSAKAGVDDLTRLFEYTDAYQITSYISFDLSLARGLDYYTGLIYEFVVASSAPPPSAGSAAEKKHAKKSKDKYIDDDDNSENVGVGSIAAGGRYDKLVGMFSNSKKGDIPCVGVSFGVERLFSLIKASINEDQLRANDTEVFVMAMGGGEGWTGFLKERMAVSKMLWEAGIKAEFQYKTKVKFRQQFEAAEKAGIPIALILGQEEYPNGYVKIKMLGTHAAGDGETVKVEDMIPTLKEKIATVNSTSALIESIRQL
ncbi:hypothetical protein CANCADRAFT_1385 [Tortispora caseinolytica NRRL Y-17796]|uniref:Histidine--tRNA ligase, mitochondrial n=1 Tax=Tortispora caseinolytica NRRL Y-17796 TaxID=767744 RepID=A0A1E4TM04_9ASCO|nr:hypothetical protein CANCADRAFT_1385 [Tortispora caseinolytica NRRL Y-17796]